jgi:hypothetical protein
LAHRDPGAPAILDFSNAIVCYSFIAVEERCAEEQHDSLEKASLVMKLRHIATIHVALAAILISVGPAVSRLLVEGTSDNIVIEAEGVPLSEVLSAMSAKFDVHLRPTPLAETGVRGRFAGSLTEVIRQLLVGYDFVVTKQQHGSVTSTHVILLGRSKSTAVPSPLRPNQTPGPNRFDGFK